MEIIIAVLAGIGSALLWAFVALGKTYDIPTKVTEEPMKEEIKEKSNREILLEASRQFVGEDASPDDMVDDALGCAESVSQVIRCLYPDFPIIPGTYSLNQHLARDNRFMGTLNLDPGNIIVSPTGTGNGTIRGHTGIIGENGRIYSNNSFTGIWELNYTIESWVRRYRTMGALKLYVYTPVDSIIGETKNIV